MAKLVTTNVKNQQNLVNKTVAKVFKTPKKLAFLVYIRLLDIILSYYIQYMS